MREGNRAGGPPGELPASPPCPFCDGSDTELANPVGSHASVSSYWCRACRSPFEILKWRKRIGVEAKGGCPAQESAGAGGASGQAHEVGPPHRSRHNRTAEEEPVGDRLEEFRSFREQMNARLLETGNLEIRRFFALDDRVYQDGALSGRTKELLGLVGSVVLRCDDCVSYHLIRCREEGVTREELTEAMSVALVVGGSITIPHLRRAVAFLDELEAEGTEG